MRLLVLALIAVLLATGAYAKPARCFTTDDGYYNCNFKAIDRNGSFTISAPNRPSFTLWIDRPGVASAVADFGTGRNVSLPGLYIRSKQDGACWVNRELNTQICAW